jgi:hypothetical protein
MHIGIGGFMRCGGGGVTALAVPAGLTATLIAGGVQIDWTDNGKAYQVYGSLDGVTYSLLAGIPVGTNTYNHYIPGGLTMYYKIRTLDGVNVSTFSSTVSIYVTDYDAQNIIARMIALSEIPTGARQTNIETTIKALKAAGCYSDQFDELVISRAHGTASAKVNIINQYETLAWGTKLTGGVTDIVFYGITELSNGDLLAGAGNTTGHYYRSVDKGANWTDEGVLLAGETGIYDFCEGTNPGVVVVGTSPTGKILRSTDWGHTWTDLGQMFGVQYVTIIRRLSNGNLIATTENSPTPATARMLLSVDEGLTWTNQGIGGTSITVTNMLCDIGGGVIIAGGGKDNGFGVFSDIQMIRSTNWGVTWINVTLPAGTTATENRFFGSASLGGGIVLAGTTDAAHILRSTDSGATWTDQGQLGTQKCISTFIHHGEGRVLLGTWAAPANGTVAYSDDWGLTWNSLGILSADQNINHMKLTSDGYVVIAAATDGAAPAKIFKSTVRPFARKATNAYDFVKFGAGALTFTADGGLNSDESTSYCKTAFIPIASSKFKQNSACFGFKVSGAQAGSGFDIQGVFGSTYCAWNNRYTVAGHTYCNGSEVDGGYYETGYNCISRANATSIDVHINAGTTNYLDNSAGVPAREFYALALNEEGTANYFIKDRLEVYWIGKVMSQAKFLALQGIINAYIAAL